MTAILLTSARNRSVVSCCNSTLCLLFVFDCLVRIWHVQSDRLVVLNMPSPNEAIERKEAARRRVAAWSKETNKRFLALSGGLQSFTMKVFCLPNVMKSNGPMIQSTSILLFTDYCEGVV